MTTFHRYNARMLMFVLTITALLTAALSGMAGLGGGTILIAVLYAVGLLPAVAVPLHAAVQLVSNGSRTLAYFQHVDWGSLRWFLVGAAPAPFILAPLVVQANPDVIRLLMAGFVLLALWPKALSFIHLHGSGGMLVAGVLAGGAGMVVGASGTLIAPFFLRDDWDKQRVIATLAVCQSAAHLLKILGFASYGYGVLTHWQWLFPMALAVVAGTWLGKRLHGQLNEAQFQGLFRITLVVLAFKLAVDGIGGLMA